MLTHNQENCIKLSSYRTHEKAGSFLLWYFRVEGEYLSNSMILRVVTRIVAG